MSDAAHLASSMAGALSVYWAASLWKCEKAAIRFSLLLQWGVAVSSVSNRQTPVGRPSAIACDLCVRLSDFSDAESAHWRLMSC